MSISGPRELWRRVADEVGRIRVVSLVVERRRGMRTRPMLPEADVMRMDLGDIVCGTRGVDCKKLLSQFEYRKVELLYTVHALAMTNP